MRLCNSKFKTYLHFYVFFFFYLRKLWLSGSFISFDALLFLKHYDCLRKYSVKQAFVNHKELIFMSSELMLSICTLVTIFFGHDVRILLISILFRNYIGSFFSFYIPCLRLIFYLAISGHSSGTWFLLNSLICPVEEKRIRIY